MYIPLSSSYRLQDSVRRSVILDVPGRAGPLPAETLAWLQYEPLVYLLSPLPPPLLSNEASKHHGRGGSALVRLSAVGFVEDVNREFRLN